MKHDKNEVRGRRLSATASALAAAAITAAAFAAFSLAQGDSSSGSGDQAAAPGPPPGAAFGFQAHAPSKQDREALEAFRDCMSEHGAAPPRISDGAPAPPSREQRAKVDEAFKACADTLPEDAQGMPPGPPPPCDQDRGSDHSSDQSQDQGQGENN